MRFLVRCFVVIWTLVGLMTFVLGITGIPEGWERWLQWMQSPALQFGVVVVLFLLVAYTFLPDEVRRRLFALPSAKSIEDLNEDNARLARERDAATVDAADARRQRDEAETALRSLRETLNDEKSPRRRCAGLVKEGKELSAQGAQLLNSMAEQYRLDAERFAKALPPSDRSRKLFDGVQRDRLSAHKPATMVSQIHAMLKTFEHEAEDEDWEASPMAAVDLVERVQRTLNEAVKDGVQKMNDQYFRGDTRRAKEWHDDFYAFLDEHLQSACVALFRTRVRPHENPTVMVSNTYDFARAGWIDSIQRKDVKPDCDPPNWKGWCARRRFGS